MCMVNFTKTEGTCSCVVISVCRWLAVKVGKKNVEESEWSDRKEEGKWKEEERGQVAYFWLHIFNFFYVQISHICVFNMKDYCR